MGDSLLLIAPVGNDQSVRHARAHSLTRSPAHRPSVLGERERCFRNPNTPRLDVLNGTIDMPLVLECGTFPKSVARIEHGERPMKRLHKLNSRKVSVL